MNKTILDGEVNYTVSNDSGVWGSSYVWHEYLNGTGNWAMTITNGTGHISINNMTIAHMWCPGGDSIYLYEHSPVDNYGNLSVNYVDFYYNCAGVGSAIRNNNGGTLIINNSQFELNRKSSSTGNDGIFYNIGDATVLNTVFDSNYARWGTILNDNKITLINTTLSNNEGYAGGSTYKYGAGFAYNSGAADYFNPGSHATTNEVINCTFINNDQSDVFGYYGPVNVTGCQFINSTGIWFSLGSENMTYQVVNNTMTGVRSSAITVSLSTGESTYAIHALVGKSILTIENNAIEMEAGIGLYVNNANITNNNISINQQNSTIIMTEANNSVIRYNNLNQMVKITGNNTLIEYNNITTPEEYAISFNNAQSINNTVKDNYLEAHFYIGDCAVNANSYNAVENNTPVTTGIIYAAAGIQEATTGTMANPTTISDAISKVADNETIILFNGNYTINETITISPDITMENTSTINIIGQDNVTINGNNTQIFNISTGYNINFENINFTNANSDKGSAIYSESNITINNCQFINNTGNTGSALYIKADKLTLNQSSFINNTAENEIIYLEDVTTKTITNNYYQNNDIQADIIIEIKYNADANMTTEEEKEINIKSITLNNPEFYDENITNGKILVYVNDELNQTLDEEVNSYNISSNYPTTLETYIIPTFTTTKSNNLTIDVIAYNLHINIDAPEVTGFINDTAVINIYLTDDLNIAVQKGTVTLYADDEEITTIEVTDGTASYQTEVLTTTGHKEIKVEYKDESNTYNDTNTTTQLYIVESLYVSPNVVEKSIGLIDDPTTLNDAINRVSNNKTIYLLNGTYTIDTPILINKDTTYAETFNLIGLDNVTIDGQNSTELLNISNVDLNINNIIFTNGNTTLYAPILINGSTIFFNNSKFTYNNGRLGGTIYLNNSVMSITNSLFDNSTSHRGIIEAVQSNMTILNTDFTNSYAYSDGGIYLYKSNLNIQNSQFINDSTSDGGVAICYYSTNSNLTVDNCTFMNLLSNNTRNFYGAIYGYNWGKNWGNVIINNSRFINTTVMTDMAGAISLLYTESVVITNNQLESVKAGQETMYVYTRNNVRTIENNTYTNCTIGLNYNLVINTETPVQVGDEVSFLINLTGLSNPDYYLSSYNYSDNESYNKFLEDRQNLAQLLSADVSYDIYLNGEYLKTTDKNVTEFTITSDKSEMSTIYVINSLNQKSNTITFESELDGLKNTIITIDDAQTFINDATFTISVTDRNNTPVTDCGSISIYEDETLIGQEDTVNGTCTITTDNFTAGNHTLTIQYNDTTSKYNNQTITTTVFALMKSVYVDNTVIEAQEGTIDNPTTITDALSKVGIGGTIYFLPGVYDLNESILLACDNSTSQINQYYRNKSFINNHVKEFTIKGIDEVIFTSNTSTLINIPYEGLTVTIENIKFVNSTQYSINTLSHTIINNCSFINNSAVSVYAFKSSGSSLKPNLNITNSLFENNTASGITWRQFILNIHNSTFQNNYAASGAALCSPQYYADFANSSNNKYINNSALNMGGAVYITQGFNSTNDIFINNKARIGGAVYINYFSSPNLNMSNATFIDCSSTGSAGAMYANAGYITLVNSTFKNIYSPSETLILLGGTRYKLVENNTYENCSILFSQFTITSPQENQTIKTGEEITLNINATLKTPRNYDSDILTRYGYQIYINETNTENTTETTTAFTPENYGTYNIYAYSQLLNSQTNNITININKYELEITPITTEIGQIINITATIKLNDQTMTDLSKGKVVFKINGKTLKDDNGKVIYAKIINGTATIENFTVPESWDKDNITIEAVYSGSIQCDAIRSDKTNITITKEQPTLTTEDINTTAGSTITLTATITDGDKVINTGKIVFKINGKTVKDANGKVIYAKVVNNTVSVEYTLPDTYKAKDYTITATFISSDYDKLTDEKTLTVN